MQATETMVKTRNGDLWLRRAGRGPTVLFIHGAAGVAGWIPFFDRLSDRFDLLVPDHPSYGRSPTPPWLDEVGDLAFFYLDLFEQLDLKDIHLVGHSMGGWLSLEIAIRSQARIRSLTLMNSVGITIETDPIANIFVMSPSEVLPLLYADPKVRAEEAARVPDMAELQRIMTARMASVRLAWNPRFYNPKLRQWLHRITVPTQIVWGAQDGLVSAAYADEFKRGIPHASVTIMPGVGHIPFVERLDDTVALVEAFVKRHS